MRTTIGERVRMYRLRRGLTQARLAHLVGRSERWLIDVERGGVDPRLSDALALARELCVAVDDLAGGPAPIEERTGRPPPRPPVLTERTARRCLIGHGFRTMGATRRGCRWLWRVGRGPARPEGQHACASTGEERDPLDRAGSALILPHVHQDPVLEAERLVRARFAAWNRADSRGLCAVLHVPHVSLPGHRLAIRESEPDLLRSPDFRALASVEGWHASALDDVDVHQSSPDKVHCLVRFGRNAADGARYANGQAVYVVTNHEGRWGIQVSSVTLRPIGVGGADDDDAVEAATSVLRRWVDARDGDDPLALRRLVHLPFVDVDGARLLVRRSGTALRRDVIQQAVARAWRHSDVRQVRVRERSAHKVTLETEIARYELGGTLVACHPVTVVVTHLQGRWALQVYSSFLTSSPQLARR